METTSFLAQLPIFLGWLAIYFAICWVIPRVIYFAVRESQTLDERDSYRTKTYLKYVFWANVIVAIIVCFGIYCNWAYQYRQTNDYKPQILVSEKQ